jgi:nucleoside-diphosphate-sugar epimerase
MKPEASRLNILVTGAYGLIGNLVYAWLAAQPAAYAVYGLTRDTEPSVRARSINFYAIPDDHVRLANISDFDAVQRAVQGMEVVVHLAADPDGQTGWESVLANNIIGAHNLFEACRLAGVKRVIYASTNQVVFGYHADERYQPLFAPQFDVEVAEAPRPIDHTLPTRPLNDYACSKVYGEALAHMYAYKHGLSCLCLRIGWVVPDDRVPYPQAQRLWCSQRDIVQLIERCINAPEALRFDIFFGQSDNRYNLVDIQHAWDKLGYRPQDRAEDRLP